MKQTTSQAIQATAAILGFIIAPAVPAVFLSLISTVSSVDDGTMGLGLAPFIYFFSFWVCFFLGIPAFALGLHLKLIRWWSALITGAVIGAVLCVGDPYALLTMCPLGAVSALTFWLIWKCGCALGEYIERQEEKPGHDTLNSDKS